MHVLNKLLKDKGLPPMLSSKSIAGHIDLAIAAASNDGWSVRKINGGTIYKMVRAPYSLIVSVDPWGGITASYKRLAASPLSFATYIEDCESVEAAKAAVIAAVEARS